MKFWFTEFVDLIEEASNLIYFSAHSRVSCKHQINTKLKAGNNDLVLSLTCIFEHATNLGSKHYNKLNSRKTLVGIFVHIPKIIKSMMN